MSACPSSPITLLAARSDAAPSGANSPVAAAPDLLVTLATVPDPRKTRTWTATILQEWITTFRPMLAVAGTQALWPSERGPRIGLQRINSRFAAYREALGLDAGLDFHGLRRSYATHLTEAGYDPLFVQFQLGHEHASTTSIYTCVSSDFRTRTLRRALDHTLNAALEPTRRTT